MTPPKNNFLFKTLQTSGGIFTVLLLIINAIAYISGIVSSGFYEEQSTLFMQSAFSIEGLLLSEQMGLIGFFGLFLLTFLSVFYFKLRAERTAENSLIDNSQSASIMKMKKTKVLAKKAV